MQKFYFSTYLLVRQFGILSFAILGFTVGHPQTFLAPPAAQAQVSQSSLTRGYTLLNQGRIEAAIASFDQILRQNPNNLEALQGLAIAYRRAGRSADALATYQRILELDPDNQLALSTLGYLGEFRSEWQPIGIQALTRLLQLNPDSVEA
ncbi:MAG: tetratricopeptide repeat protein, partial [Leptolyngbya sp. SIO1D8]|nr:tetratricopeptide repeat protein [Leptolyngbya sp. SIO1D8]